MIVEPTWTLVICLVLLLMLAVAWVSIGQLPMKLETVVAAGRAAIQLSAVALVIVAALTHIATAAALAVALQTEKGAAAWDLAKEARVEVRKVVWPTPQETTQTTLIVVVVVLIVALMLWGIDSGLSWGVQGVIG